MEGRGRLPWGGEEDGALQEPSRVHVALADGVLASKSIFSRDIAAPFTPAQAKPSGAELKGRKPGSVEVPEHLHRSGGCAWIPLCWKGKGIRSGIQHGERRGCRQGLAPAGSEVQVPGHLCLLRMDFFSH